MFTTPKIFLRVYIFSDVYVVYYYYYFYKLYNIIIKGGNPPIPWPKSAKRVSTNRCLPFVGLFINPDRAMVASPSIGG